LSAKDGSTSVADGRRRTAVLISGRGSNLGALIAAARRSDYPAELVLVVSNTPGAEGLARASKAGIPAQVVDHRAFETKAAFEAALDRALRTAGVELICLAGFMRILSPAFVDAWRDRILNIHPSLLPLHPGLDTHARAIAAGDKDHGATVHLVRAETDQGPIVMQEATPILPGDTPETLAARVLAVEHRIYPLALALLASGQARIVGGCVAFEGTPEAATAAPS
jgi:phosphoribosylglycinamide formyltransferase 1